MFLFIFLSTVKFRAFLFFQGYNPCAFLTPNVTWLKKKNKM